MVMNYFTLDGHSTTEWGIGLSAGGAYDAPARKGESISVPGRNGNIWVDGGAYENIMLTYPCWMSEGFDTDIDDFRAFLSLHSDRYYKLTDTYHPGEYRMARYAGPFTPQLGTRNKSGRFDVVFDCYPLRYFDQYSTWVSLPPDYCFEQVAPGEPVVYTPNWSNTNPSRFTAMPVVKVSGTPTTLTPSTTGLMFATLTQDVSGAIVHLIGAVRGKVYYVDFNNSSVRSSSSDLGDSWESASIDSSITLRLWMFADEPAISDVLGDLPYSGGVLDAGVNQVAAIQENLTLLGILPRYSTI